MHKFTYEQSITQLPTPCGNSCCLARHGLAPPVRHREGLPVSATPHRQLLIFNTFASGGSLARRVARDVASWWQVAGETRLHVATARWLGVHANGLLFTCFLFGLATMVSMLCVCVCSVCGMHACCCWWKLHVISISRIHDPFDRY